ALLARLACVSPFEFVAYPLTSFSSGYVVHPALRSFPTRRSSDLGLEALYRRAAFHPHAADHPRHHLPGPVCRAARRRGRAAADLDRKSTRLNSSHVKISYAAFCLKNKTGARSRDLPARRHRVSSG